MFFRPGLRLTQALSWIQQALPSQCSICGRWPSQRICSDCCARWAPEQLRCRRCALPLAGGAEECGACLRAPPAFDATWAAVDYGYPWSMLLTQFKFGQDPGAAHALAQLLARTPGAAAALASAHLIVPIALSRERLRERGFNQAALLAQALARLTGSANYANQLLLRSRHTAPQSSLQRGQRLGNLRNAFLVPAQQAAQITGQTVVLVDDIMTTGATLEAASQALRVAGAIHICAMVVARTPHELRQ